MSHVYDITFICVIYYMYIIVHLNVLCIICVAVACGARLSCSVFMVYSVLLSVSLVAHAPI